MSNVIPKDEFTSEQIKFIHWLATPDGDKCTQKELADKLNMSPSTLSKWKQKKDITNAAYDLTLQLINADKLPKILNSLANEAINGDTRAAKLLFEVTGKTQDKSGVNVEGDLKIVSNVPRPSNDAIDVSND